MQLIGHCSGLTAIRLLLSLFLSAANAQTPPATCSGTTRAQLQLGCKIFMDPRLSRDQHISCASCHQPAQAFSDGRAVAQGIDQQQGTRNTPSLLNASYTDSKFWDGRRPNLQAQVLEPFTNPREHGLKDQAELLEKFHNARDYATIFKKALGYSQKQAKAADLAEALSAYITQLKPQHTRLQRFFTDQDKTALTAEQQQGLRIFRERAHCNQCHTLEPGDTRLTDDDYHIRGVGLSNIAAEMAALSRTLAAQPQIGREQQINADTKTAALGRFVLTLNPSDVGKFKTPSLHEVSRTAPYMHDGSLGTLEAAVDWELYYQGHTTGQPVILSQTERAQLLVFLRALTTGQPETATENTTPTPAGEHR